MHIPKHYLGKNEESAVAFMRRFNFASITTSISGVPTATHLPFVIEKRDNQLILTSHFAKANDHWKCIETNPNLVIFSEPHAYISPQHYTKKENVPTWNYIAVHAYGRATIVNEKERVFNLLEAMMHAFDPSYKDQWEGLPVDYKSRMANGIVAFEIVVTDLQFKEKLSQNKTSKERISIIDDLTKSSDSNEKALGDYMKKNEL